MALSSTSLAVTVAHAVTFLSRTHSLATLLTPAALAALQSTLEANLAAAFCPTWVPAAPSQGAGRRVLAFAPDALPPRPVYKACVTVGVEPRLFATREFELMVDPGMVSVRVPGQWGLPGTTSVAWSAQEHQGLARAQQQPIQRPQAPRMPQPIRGHRSQSSSVSSMASFASEGSSCNEVPLKAPQPKTLAQRLMEEHDAADEAILFSDLAAASSAPWKAQINSSDADAFARAFPSSSSSSAASFNQLAYPAASAATGALQSVSMSVSGYATSGSFAARAAIGHSRSSSRSSVSSGALSLLSDDSLSTCASLSSVSTSLSSLSLASQSSGSSGSSGTAGSGKRSRRVFVDNSKNEVTQYDGGKTNVLTGGVMLGGPQRKPARSAVPRF